MNGINLKIMHQIYSAMEKLNAPLDLLAPVGSYGDTLDDGDVLEMLEQWNLEHSTPPQRKELN